MAYRSKGAKLHIVPVVFLVPKTATSNEGCEKLTKHQIQYCYQCNSMPCAHLARLDSRYREPYAMNMLENQKTFKAKGMKANLEDQALKHRCPNCSGVICVHDGKCYSCRNTNLKR